MNRKFWILISYIFLLSLTVFILWYLFPYISYKWFIFNNKHTQKIIDAKPKHINRILQPPSDWNEVNIDEFRFKIPLSKYHSIRGTARNIIFQSKSEALMLYDFFPLGIENNIKTKDEIIYPFESFIEKTAKMKITSSDISILNSRATNYESYTKLKNKVLKSAGVSSLNSYIVNKSLLKATFSIYVSDKYNSKVAFINIYNANETVMISIVLKRYKKTDDLLKKVLKILGGIKMPSTPLNIEIAKQDIKNLFK